MAGLITEAEFRAFFSIDSDAGVSSQQITPGLGAASVRVKGWVGAATYADAEADDAAADQIRRNALDMAEAYLAMYFNLPGFNTGVTERGMPKTWTTEGGMVIANLTPKEMSELQKIYLDMAETSAGPYMVKVDASSESLRPTMFALASGRRGF